MVKFLGFDTCLDKMFVALSEDGEIKTSKVVENTDTHYHSAYLISTIREILLNANLKPQDIDIITTNAGPGSFTGIRACNTVARVFAQANDIKTIGLSSLEILSRLSDVQKVLVTLDARKEKAYIATYENKKEIIHPQAMPLEDVIKMAKSGEYDVITDNRLLEQMGGKSYQKLDADLGKILLELAFEKYQNNKQQDWRKLKPLYIQPPPVTISAKNK